MSFRDPINYLLSLESPPIVELVVVPIPPKTKAAEREALKTVMKAAGATWWQHEHTEERGWALPRARYEAMLEVARRDC